VNTRAKRKPGPYLLDEQLCNGFVGIACPLASRLVAFTFGDENARYVGPGVMALKELRRLRFDGPFKALGEDCILGGL
jgi:hypothetical protein